MICICKPIDLLHNICQLRIAVARNTRMIYDWLCYVANSCEKCFLTIGGLIIPPCAILIFSKCNTAKFRKDDWLSCKSIAVGIDFSPLRISLKERIHIMIPLFYEMFKLNLLNTFIGLILPRATNAFGIFMMRQFFVSLPKGLEEAARLDGCSEFTIFRKIMLPLCKPAVISLAIFHFMYNWNDLLYPLILTTRTEMRTLPAGLATFMGTHVIEHNVLMAGGVLAILPIFIAYCFAQKYFVQGIAMTGMKG